MMHEYVIPNKLTADVVSNLPGEAVDILAGISSTLVLQCVNKFIEKSEQTTDLVSMKAAKILKEHYAALNERNKYLESSDTRALAEELITLSFEDISYNVSEEKLKKWLCLINEFLESDYAVPYVDKVTTKSVEGAVGRLSEMCDNVSDKERSAIISLISVIDKNKGLFRDAPFKKDKPTVLRGLTYQKDDLCMKKEGIEYLLKKKAGGNNPMSWRLL